MLKFYGGASLAALLIATPALAQEAISAAKGETAATIGPARDQAEMADIVVIGRRAATPSLGALGDRPILDSPFSISTYDGALLKDIQARSLTDMLRLEPSATTSLADVTEGTNFLLRGFSVSTYYMDSVPGLGGSRSDPPLELYDGVQVLKGAAGFLFGFTSPGGIVNFVSKRPRSQPFLSAEVGYTQDSLYRGHVDTGYSTTDGRFGTRLNAAGERGQNRHLDTGVRRHSIGLNNNFQLTPTTTIQLDGQHSRRKLLGSAFGIQLSPGLAIPDPISGTTRLGAKFGGYRYEIDSGNLAVIQQIGGDWTARLDGALTRNVFSFYDTARLLTNGVGDTLYGNFKVNQRTVTKAGQLRISGSIETGLLDHAITLGLYGQRQETLAGRASNGLSTTGTFLPGGNIYQDFPDIADPGFELPSLKRGYRSQNLTEKAAFLSDTISVGDHLQVLLGGRYIWREQTNLNPAGAVTRRDEREKFTPTTALLWKPTEKITGYVSYSESLQAGGTAPAGSANVGEVMQPMVSRQYEVGVKVQVGALLASAATFRIERSFEFLMTRLGELPLYVQDGTQRHDGVELSVSGHAGEAWRFVGGVQLLDAKIHDGLPALVGKEPPAVPEFQAKLLAEYAPPALDGFAINTTLNYTGSSAFNTDNSLSIDDFFTLGAGARYRFDANGTPVTARVAVNNLTNKKYWMPSSLLIPGAPRSITASLAVDF
ncbi:TonB-dependent siderophore receptor [Niveispirillum fermenti]|uniref:TonB-dependent siderophore receptor n=1 Tax=Niveispirillum fermenti TaxID=1233113 RepID=UPI003A866076